MNTQEMVQIALDLAKLDELPMDSAISVEGENITSVLAGIDMGAAELSLARQLGYDCVARHHNMVPRLGKLGDLVAHDHYEKMVKYGVPVNVAQKLLEHRKRAVEIMFHGSNLDGAPSVARLLGMPYVGLHTPADLLGERAVEAKVAEVCSEKENPTVQDVLDKLLTIREYAQAPEGQKPAIWVGEPTSYAGKVIVEFAGGLAGELDELKAYIDAGVGTFICMHMDGDIVKALREDNRCNVLVMGHMSSDSIGFNQILDAWEAKGVKVTRVGGLI
ncbi:conserved hypothetical protein [uncultured Eubacteriales bacterium]|uniref:GTP cyclohydrolase 1 type 2 homolog n=1 Tax=uncultured Eubacteriales bacterium TaxID=172733 RepID=A0A212KGG9_9FIRM|nr:conserved hypothetical protein [uncultured Eubacteriales bacterium]